jgi:metal-dependent hydrolase (beta-lactamase superfamily II)
VPRGSIFVAPDAFGKTNEMTKDWGYAAVIEVGDRCILFDTGNDPEICAKNVKAKGLELKELSLAIDTPDGIVLVVGCSHPGIDKIVEATSAINTRIHFRRIAPGRNTGR